jgi:hypothetical protein
MFIENVETFSGAAQPSPLVFGNAKHGVVDVSQLVSLSSERLGWSVTKALRVH